MISRRKFLGYSAAAASVPILGSAFGAHTAAAAAPETLKFRLVNNSGTAANAYVVGLHKDSSDGRGVFVKADSSTYFPPRPGGGAEPITENVAIPINGSTEVTVPRMYGARVYFVTDDKLEFLAVQGDGDKAAIAHPSFVNDADPNFGRNWTFAEFTLDPTQIYANISYVDFVAAPIGLKLDHVGGTQEVPGLNGGAVDTIATALRQADGGKWGACVQEANGKVVRVLNPNHRPDDFAGYLEPFVDEVWSKYAGETLIIDSQRGDIGILEGRVEGDQLVFGAERFGKPTSADIWGCNSGPFANNPGSDTEQRKAIVPRLAAAFNRTTLLINNKQPHEEKPETFYKHSITNHYARVVHENLPDGRGYAFAYDDVSANPSEDHSGKVNHGEPNLLTITLNRLR
ncbi:beta-1,3-glucanase [Herbihabitans rhizosphaerae]|uniref:Beta-1,3-glucanase n=1 Tax=Herbihabitans rhizosphaerae TaxID=1872711 RepID=A0A4Q7KRL7_9PSEU|nr:glycoside hydrolase family 64 protein [Herbihabitans rhizosphaerae]RZS39205.1 beta-1,3-glucanase [Herbihabitans rhizosphaerae]